MKVRLIFGVFLASAAMAVAGCGSSSSDTTAKFKSGYDAVRGPLNQTGEQIAQELTKAPKQADSQVESAFQGLAQRWGSQVTQLGKLSPPSDLQSEWNKVVQAGTKVEADLLAVATAAKTHNTSLAQSAGKGLGRNAEALTAAVAPIKAKLGLK
jgi:hypothetical protein